MRSLGLLRWHEGRHEEALEITQNALAIARERGDRLAVAGDLANVGVIFKSMGITTRDRQFRRWVVDARLAQDPSILVYSLQNVANVHRELGDLDRAREYLERANEIARAHLMPIQRSFHLMGIAHILFRQGRIEESLQTYRESIELSRRAHHADGLVQSLRALGDVLFGLQRDAEAAPLLEEAAVLFARLEDRTSEVEMLSRVATILERSSQQGKALEIWRRVRALYGSLGDARGELAALEGIARVMRKSPASRDEAITYTSTALALACTLGDIATGAHANRPSLPGIDEPWVHVIRTAADSDGLRTAASTASSAVVVGGGWIAAETAASLRQLGLAVTLVVTGSEILERHLGPVVGRELTALHERNGVRVMPAGRAVALEAVGGRRGVRLASGELVEGDIAVLGLGATPSTDLATSAGLAVGDGIVADEHLATAAEGVFVAGDVASAWHPRYGERVRSEHWDNARRQGRTAARNMVGRDEAYERVPYFYSDQFDLGLELFGRPAGADDPLVRREDGGGLVALWLRDGAAVAGMHANLRGRRKALDALVTAGARVDRAAFADPAVPLEEAAAARVEMPGPVRRGRRRGTAVPAVTRLGCAAMPTMRGRRETSRHRWP